MYQNASLEGLGHSHSLVYSFLPAAPSIIYSNNCFQLHLPLFPNPFMHLLFRDFCSPIYVYTVHTNQCSTILQNKLGAQLNFYVDNFVVNVWRFCSWVVIVLSHFLQQSCPSSNQASMPTQRTRARRRNRWGGFVMSPEAAAAWASRLHGQELHPLRNVHTICKVILNLRNGSERLSHEGCY